MAFPLTADELLASAVQFLIEGGEDDAANILLSCEIELGCWEGDLYDGRPDQFFLNFTGPRIVFDQLNDDTVIRTQVWRAFEAVAPIGWHLVDITAKAQSVISLDPDWHQELLEIARGKNIHNQASGADNAKLWNRLRFRSVTEIQIAQALDKVGVLFFPLPMARLSAEGRRINREPDFLVCDEGRWGVLEADGAPYHPAERSAHEHQRDRLFLDHGVRLVQRFDATDCFATPDKVVSDFLRLLKRAHS